MNYVENGASEAVFKCSDTKKNIFLIGDSIRKGYCAHTKEALKDKAEVFYFEDNCRSSQYIIFSLKKWAGMFDDRSKIDIVQFNCGQWDTAHWNGYEYSLTSESEYEKNIRMIIFLIKKFFPNAIVVFATTSPMNPEEPACLNLRSNAEVTRYNEIALEVANECNIPVIDVNAFMRDWGSANFKDVCHLTDEAYEKLGIFIASQLEKII